MKALKKYVEMKNLRASLFGDAQMDADNLSQAEINSLLESVDCDLSPENLTCDGELPRDKVAAKQAFLIQVNNELMLY